MHKTPWKLAFFILFILNLLTVSVLFVATRPKAIPMAPKRQQNQTQDFEVTLTANALEKVVKREIEDSGATIHFSIAKDFYFRMPISLYGISSELVLQSAPSVGEDGLLHLSIHSIRLGSLHLPERAALSLAQRAIAVEGIAVDTESKEIILDPSAFLNIGNVAMRAKSLDKEAGRFVFQGNLGDL